MGHYASEMDPDFGKPAPEDPDVLRCKDIQLRCRVYISRSADARACQLATMISELAEMLERLI